MASGGLKKLARRIQSASGLKIRAGILAGATYPDTGKSVAEIAIIQEYGAPAANIPPRPFLKNTVGARQGAWARCLSDNLSAYIRGRISLDDVGKKVGVLMQSDIIGTINNSVPPPNAPAVARRKEKRGMAPRTLIDSGVLLDSVSFEVEK